MTESKPTPETEIGPANQDAPPGEEGNRDNSRIRLKLWLVIILAVIAAIQLFMIIQQAGLRTVPIPAPGEGGHPSEGARGPGPAGARGPENLGLDELAEGIVKIVKTRPDLALKSAPAEKISSQLERAARSRADVYVLMGTIYTILTPEQMDYIQKHRQDPIQMPDGVPSGEEPRIWAVQELLKSRSAGAVGQPPASSPPPSSYRFQIQDLSEGILRLEKQKSLALTREQAAALRPVLEEVNHHYKVQFRASGIIQENLDQKQIDFIRSLGGKHELPPDRVLEEAARAVRGK